MLAELKVPADVFPLRQVSGWCMGKKHSREIDLLCAPVSSFIGFAAVYFSNNVLSNVVESLVLRAADALEKTYRENFRKYYVKLVQSCPKVQSPADFKQKLPRGAYFFW